MLSIIGSGKMGKWFAKHLRDKIDILVYDVDSKKAEAVAKEVRVNFTKNIKEAMKPGIILVCVSLSESVKVIEEVGKQLNESQTLIEIASLKTEIIPKLKELQCKKVSIHPMFGPDVDSMEGQNVIVISDVGSDRTKENALKLFEGANISEVTAEEHDKIMAVIHALPYAMNIAFWELVQEKEIAEKYYGTRFPEQLEIAKKIIAENEDLKKGLIRNPNAKKILEEYIEKIKRMSK